MGSDAIGGDVMGSSRSDVGGSDVTGSDTNGGLSLRASCRQWQRRQRQERLWCVSVLMLLLLAPTVQYHRQHPQQLQQQRLQRYYSGAMASWGTRVFPPDWQTLVALRDQMTFVNPSRSPQAFWKSADNCEALYGVVCDINGYVTAL
ncbi:unnamed protein product, partial [Closterium sp. NIES-54]